VTRCEEVSPASKEGVLAYLSNGCDTRTGQRRTFFIHSFHFSAMRFLC
jgi:hypothetical protein